MKQRNFAGRWALMAVVVLGLVLAGACSSGNSDDEARSSGAAAPATATQAAGTSTDKPPFSPVIASSEQVVGQNRFALGILDNATGQPLPDAQVNFRFFTLQGNQGTLRFEAPTRFVAPARDVANATPHGGGSHPQTSLEDFVGVYVAQVSYDQPGQWGVEATFKTKDGRDGRITAAYEVLTESVSPAVGSAAPRTRNLTARDVKDLKEIDSSSQPVAALHQETVADAIAAGKPVLVALATPGFCETRFCGPTVEIIEKLVPKYGDKAALIHIEIWKDFQSQTMFDAVKEWRIKTEPYIFVIDRNGIISDKFEGPVSLAELDAALSKVTSPS